jgi:hypothetical protein
MGITSAKEGLADMRKLFGYLEVFDVLNKVSVLASGPRHSSWCGNHLDEL